MWRETPLQNVVLDRIKKIGTSVTDQDLYKEIQKSVDYPISFADFLKTLMTLEIRGYISVSTIREDLRMVTYLGDRG